MRASRGRLFEVQWGSPKVVVGIDQSPKNIDTRSPLRLRQASDDTLVAATGMRSHLLHEAVAGRRAAPELRPQVMRGVAPFHQPPCMEASKNSCRGRAIDSDLCGNRGLVHLRAGRERLEQTELDRR